MRLKIIVFLLLLVVVPAFSADKFQTEYRYALSGIGFSQQKITYLSPLYYQGVSLVTSRGKVKLSENRMVSSLYETNLDLNYKNPNSYFYSLGFDYYYNSNFRLRWENYPDNIPDLFVGFGYWLDAEFYAKTSNSNNPCYYNLNNMLTFSFCCEKKFERVSSLTNSTFRLPEFTQPRNTAVAFPIFSPKRMLHSFRLFTWEVLEKTSRWKTNLMSI
ncbi:MAG TPA: hypothetical protein PLB87_00590 [Prolixibacteraceae bacterium]|nr:hypothetical protein [Prolixibacteraceae bacterium]